MLHQNGFHFYEKTKEKLYKSIIRVVGMFYLWYYDKCINKEVTLWNSSNILIS